MKYLFWALIFFLMDSCKIQPGSSRHYADGDENKVYKLVLRPKPGTRFYYDVSSETEVVMKVNDKEIDNLNRSHTGVIYVFTRDSAGDLLFEMHYDKIHLYTRNDGVETELDAANAATSDDPIEKALGALVDTRIVARVSPAGVVRSVTGYREMTDRIMTGFSYMAPDAQAEARKKIEQLIGNGIVRQNMDQLFRIFPDSAVHIGDRWKLSTPQQGELNLNAESMFTLKGIDDGIAHLTSEGKLSGDSTAVQLKGYAVTPDLKGTQEGEYEMDTHTGMLLRAEMRVKVEGAIRMMGVEVPLTLDVHVKMKGQQLQ
jgi:hypothetical protein